MIRTFYKCRNFLKPNRDQLQKKQPQSLRWESNSRPRESSATLCQLIRATKAVVESASWVLVFIWLIYGNASEYVYWLYGHNRIFHMDLSPFSTRRLFLREATFSFVLSQFIMYIQIEYARWILGNALINIHVPQCTLVLAVCGQTL